MWESQSCIGDGKCRQENSTVLTNSSLTKKLISELNDWKEKKQPTGLHSATEQMKPELMKVTDSGVDFDLSSALSELSIAQVTLNRLHCPSFKTEPSVYASPRDGIEKTKDPYQYFYLQDDTGNTLLHVMIMEGRIESALRIIESASHPCLLNIMNDNRQTALHLAVLTHQPEIVRRLLLAGTYLSTRNAEGNTALHLACISGDLTCASALTSPLTTEELVLSTVNDRLPLVPQNLEQRNYTGATCLHLAASNGHAKLVELLVHLGADVKARENLAGRTALHLAVECRYRDIIIFLVQKCKPLLQAATYAGITPYQIAACYDSKLAWDLLKFGARQSSIESNYQVEAKRP